MINHQQARPLCKKCGILPSRKNGKSAKGFQRWHSLCNRCANIKYKKIKEKSDVCGWCGFISVDSCQICMINSVSICLNCNALRLKQNRKKAELTVDATVFF